MEKKTLMLAFAALAVLGLAFTGLYMSEDSDAALTPPETAAGTKDVTMNTDIGATATTKVIKAYGPLDDAGIYNQGVWYVAKGGQGQAYAAADPGELSGNTGTFTFNNVDQAGLNVVFTVTKNAGEYVTEIEATGITQSHDVYAAFGIISYSTQAPSNFEELGTGTAVIEQWVEYKLQIVKKEASAAVPIVFDKSPNGFDHTGSDLELDTGVYVSFDIKTAVASEPNLEGATWYATGLPSGLTMSSNGTIFGYLSKQETQPADVFVNAQLENVLYTATIHVSSKAPAGATPITLEITNISGVGTPTLVDMGSSKGVVNRYVTVGTGTLTVSLEVTGAGNMTGESFAYRAIAKEGAAEDIVMSCTGNALSITYSGSGEFIIMASYAGNEQVLMQLVSVAPVQDVVADIQFNVTNNSASS